MNRVRHLEADPETLESIFEAMPTLMKSLVLGLGRPGSTKAQRDVMYFVHKYRKSVSLPHDILFSRMVKCLIVSCQNGS